MDEKNGAKDANDGVDKIAALEFFGEGLALFLGFVIENARF